jgi:transcription antitermination factor NusG
MEETPMIESAQVRIESAGSEDSLWYAVHTRSNYEAKVANCFRAFDVEVFLPDYPSKRQWNDREKIIRLPLFPGYVFSRFQKKLPSALLGTPGLAHIVGFADGPAPIPEEEIESVRRLVENGLGVCGWCPRPSIRLRATPKQHRPITEACETE